MAPRRFASFGAALALTLGGMLAACDGTDARPATDTIDSDQIIPPELTRVETAVAPLDIPAGGSVVVTCQGKDQYDGDIEANLAFDVLDPAGRMPDGVTVVGNTITATRAGAFRVQCYWAGPPRLADTSPVSVNVQAGAPTEIVTSLFTREVKAGNNVSVACSARDANGNISSVETTVRVTPTDGTTVTGRRVTFTQVGVFDVVCMTADASIIGGDPVAVTVIPAGIYEIQTVLSANEIAPGEQVDVTCPGKDRFGNTVALDKIITFPVDGLDALDTNRLKLTSERAGSYPVTCAPKESWVHPAISVPATLVVHPGPPATLTLDLSPDRAVFALGTRVKATGRVSDAFGNAITDLGDDVRVDAWFDGEMQQQIVSGERIDLDLEGTWTLIGRVQDTALETTRTLLADGSAPTIDLTFPTRGQMVTGDGGALTVTGFVRDATGGLASLKINGATQPVTRGENEIVLAKSVPAAHGLNTLTIEATDVNDNVTKIVQSYLVAPGWKPATQAFADGIIAHLAKAFLDDGNRTGAANDLATIFQRFVSGIDIQAYVPSPVVTYSGFDVYLQSIDYDEPQLTITPALDSLLLTIDITNLAADIYADGFIDVDGTVTVDAIHLDMQLDISIAAGGAPRVTARAAVVEVEGLDIDVHWSINWLIDLFTNQIRDSIVSSFEDILKEQIPPVLADALAAFQINQGFEIPAFLPGATALPVQLAAKPDHTDIDEQGLDLALGTKVTAAKKVPWATLGSIMRGGCFGTDGGTPAWDATKKLTFGISLDVINQILHAVWQGGALEVQLGEEAFEGVDLSQYGVANLALTLSARLPPVLTDCSGAIMLQLGELQVDATLDLAGAPLVIGMIIAFDTTADVSVDADGVLGLALGAIDPADILVDVTRLESELFDPTQEDVIVQLLKDQLLGNLLGNIAGQSLANFPIPEIDLGALDPSLAGQVIAIKGVELKRSKGYLLLQGNP